MKKKQVVRYCNYKMALIKYQYSRTPIPHPRNSTIHAIPYVFIRIICGPIWGSFPVRDHFRSNLGIICGPGSFAVLGSFADPYRPPDRRGHWSCLFSVRGLSYLLMSRHVVYGYEKLICYGLKCITYHIFTVRTLEP